MKKILFLVNHDVVIYNFRREIVERFIADGHEVHISSPYGERIEDLIRLGAIFHEIKMDRHGMNPKEELRILHEYKKLMEEIKPDICLGFTIKPNIYGALAARKHGIPFVANITGLGTSIQNGGIKQKLSLLLYKNGLKKVQKVFFQNEADKDFFLNNKIIDVAYEVLPGSGVNLQQHKFEEYPTDEQEILFTTFGRIMKDKGIDELLSAAKEVKIKGVKARFRLIGFFDDDEYKEIVSKAVSEGYVEYIGQQKDVHPFIKESHAIIQPSHHEGLSNVLLESESAGRPVIASNIPGCKEAFDEGISGLGFEVKNYHSLVEAIMRFVSLPNEKKALMGREARNKMEKQFDRNIVVNKYLREVEKIGEKAR